MEAPIAAPRRRVSLADYLDSPLAHLLGGEAPFEVASAASGESLPSEASRELVFAGYRLQEIADYRAAIRRWFKTLVVGGRLFIVVPHAFLYERLLALPGRWDPAQRRLYTPASLMSEVEEALAPNSYRVRWLSDDDDRYDYTLDRDLPPVGAGEVLLVLERIAPPSWGLAEVPEVKAYDPDYEFEPNRTRVEFVTTRAMSKVLILKLDHLGDFIMGMAALEKARAVFADAEITLIVGSWNLEIARRMNVADHVLAFDVFPSNSSEEEVDVQGKTALFQALMTEDYDLAIDLRTDTDTRFLLKSARTGLRAGVGTRAQFDFLDVALPLDFNRNEPETAREFEYNHHAFSSQGQVYRNDFRIALGKKKLDPKIAIIWGPYRALRPGTYIYEPFLELDPLSEGLLSIDVALDTKWVVHKTVPAPEGMRLKFRVDKPGAVFEARVWALENTPPIPFNFYGGRLIRKGASSVLHQSEYLLLLIELISMRVARFGLLSEGERPS